MLVPERCWKGEKSKAPATAASRAGRRELSKHSAFSAVKWIPVGAFFFPCE